MNRIQGNPQSAPIECINPVRSKWRVRWDFQSDDNGNGSFMEQEFDHKPSLDEIKAVVIEWCNVVTNLKLGQNAIENWATDDRQS
jgi:hypothetical protein